MRIALVAPHALFSFPHLGCGGTESCLENLAAGLHQGGQDFFVVCPRRDPEEPRSYPFPVIAVDYWPTWVRSIPGKRCQQEYCRRVRAVLASEKPDLILLQGSEDPVHFHTLGRPIIVTNHSPCGVKRFRMVDYGNVRYRFLSRAQRDAWVRDETQERISFRLYTGFADEEFAFAEAPGDYYLWVANLGWGFEEKGLDVFLRLAAYFRDLPFVAYGAGDAAVAARLEAFQETHPNFEFRGQLERGRRHREAFRRARALVHVTRLGEALGRTTMEAMTKGTPVLGNRDGATPEQLGDDGGVLCDDPDGMPGALERAAGLDRRRVFESSRRFHVRHEVAGLLRAARELF